MNIGQPFNTLKDDMGFVISGKGEVAYFIRDLDIYYADLNQTQVSLNHYRVSLIFGKIMPNNQPEFKRSFNHVMVSWRDIFR